MANKIDTRTAPPPKTTGTAAPPKPAAAPVAKPAAPAAPAKKQGWLAKLETSAESVLDKAEREATTALNTAESRVATAAKKIERSAEQGLKSAEKTVVGMEMQAQAIEAKVERKADAIIHATEIKVELQANTIGLSSHGVLKDLANGIAHALDFRTDHKAFETISGMTDEQLACVPEGELAHWTRQMLDPTLADDLTGANHTARSQQALRLLTAHGTDAGSMDAICSRLPYLHDTLDKLKGAARAQYAKLLAGAQAVPGDWAGFDKYLDKATGTQARPGTTVTPLIDGQNAFPEMYSAIDNAKSSVDMSVYCFQSDKTGWEMAKHLAEAAKRGVSVKLIYDPMGSKESAGLPTDPKVYDFMRQAGVQVIAQQPTALADHLTHRKITVVDGQTGFTGGMNVGDEYSTIWHDVHSKVQGPAVGDLQNLFVQQWKRDGGQVTPQDVTRMFPPLRPVAQSSARVIGHEGCSDQNIKLAYLRAIDTAKTNINIANPYFSDPDVMKHLEAAAKRGVDVKVVLPKTNDMGMEQNASRALYLDLLTAGVHVYEYSGRPMAHDKVATFDGSMSTIGSSNLDARSLGNNDEANVWTSDPSVAADLDAHLFSSDLKTATPITLDMAKGFRSEMNKIALGLSEHL